MCTRKINLLVLQEHIQTKRFKLRVLMEWESNGGGWKMGLRDFFKQVCTCLMSKKVYNFPTG